MGKRMNILNAPKAMNEDLCKKRARERTLSKTSLKSLEASFGKQLHLTWTLKWDISSKSHFSSPLIELSIVVLSDWAAALPGV
jgi:hypothetical protein